jgi:2-iminobutanoate/2-iminopropanoate deaminase
LQPILTGGAPAPIGPYSQAIRAGEYLFCSGQVALDPATGELVGTDAPTQARQAMKNVAAVLKAGGTSFANVVKTTIFLVDMSDFAEVNTIYGEAFPQNPPARSTIAVAGLPKGARVEIEVIAHLG